MVEDSNKNRLVRNYDNYVRRVLKLTPGYVNQDAYTTLTFTNTTWAPVNGGIDATVRYLANSEVPTDVSCTFMAESAAAQKVAVGIGDTSVTTAAIAGETDLRSLENICLRYSIQKLPGSYTLTLLARTSGGTGKLHAGLPFFGGGVSAAGLTLEGASYG